MAATATLPAASLRRDTGKPRLSKYITRCLNERSCFLGYALCLLQVKGRVREVREAGVLLCPGAWALVSGLVLGVLIWYAFRGITPRLPVPESWVVIDACVMCLVAVVVAIILDVRGE